MASSQQQRVHTVAMADDEPLYMWDDEGRPIDEHGRLVQPELTPSKPPPGKARRLSTPEGDSMDTAAELPAQGTVLADQQLQHIPQQPPAGEALAGNTPMDIIGQPGLVVTPQKDVGPQGAHPPRQPAFPAAPGAAVTPPHPAFAKRSGLASRWVPLRGIPAATRAPHAGPAAYAPLFCPTPTHNSPQLRSRASCPRHDLSAPRSTEATSDPRTGCCCPAARSGTAPGAAAEPSAASDTQAVLPPSAPADR